jgi:hypothetical protein
MNRKAPFILASLVILAAGAWLAGCQASQPGSFPPEMLEVTPTGLPSPTPVPTPVPGVLFVDASIELGAVSPLLYGSNYGPWIAVPPDMLDEAAQVGTTIFRFPGGEWGDHNELKTYHIDAFMGFLELMGGAEGYITVRLLNGTAEAAAEMVRYVNLEKGYKVRYWSIGNEPTLFADSLANHGIPDYNTDQFNADWREFALSMKAVDPQILLVGPELHQWAANPGVQPKDSAGRDWMVEFLRANGDLVDVVSFHRYPFPGPGSRNATVEDLRQNTREWDENIRTLRSLIRAETGRDIPIAVTEINSHYSKAIMGEGTPDSHYNAIWWADILGKMMRDGVHMVNHWLITSSGGQGGWGLVSRGEVRPSYYVYVLFGQFGDHLVYSSSDDPLVSVYAARRGDGALTILVVNLSDDEITKPFTLQGRPAGTAEVWRLDLSHNAENVGTLDLASGQVMLPPQSVSLFVAATP